MLRGIGSIEELTIVRLRAEYGYVHCVLGLSCGMLALLE
jgi:hypothetical protein